MRRVLLICGAGTSSGFMTQVIRKAAKKRGIELSCKSSRGCLSSRGARTVCSRYLSL